MRDNKTKIKRKKVKVKREKLNYVKHKLQQYSNLKLPVNIVLLNTNKSNVFILIYHVICTDLSLKVAMLFFKVIFHYKNVFIISTRHSK